MKKFHRYIMLATVLVIVSTGCKKKIDEVSEVVKVTYPSIVLNGSPAAQIPVGGTYSDEGATLTDDISGAVSQITPTSNGVDPTTPGIYPVTYIAANTNGFKTTVTRNVLVLDYTPPANLTLDLSGKWLRAATGVEVRYTQVQPGLYVLDRVGGSTAVPAYLITPNDSTIEVPAQQSYDGGGPLSLDVTNETLTISPTDTTITYKIAASGFGTSTRTFVKVQ